jgi:hypothetical protein
VARRVLFALLLIACVLLLAKVSDRYSWRWDLTVQQSHSLSASAQRALDALQAPLEISAFIPEYPVQRAEISKLLAPYLAHPTRPSLRFVDPVAEPVLTRESGVTRHGELQLRSGERREVVGRPSAAAIDAALNRLALRGERWVVGFKGHGESEVNDTPGGLGRFVRRVENLGYRFVTLDPRQIQDLPGNATLLILTGPRQAYDEHIGAQIRRFIAGGGSVWWLLDRSLPAWTETELGVSVLPGVVVDAAAAQYGLDHPDNAVITEYPAALFEPPPVGHAVLKQARAIELSEREEWKPVGRLQSSARSWNETGDLRGRIARNPALGEQAGPLTIGVALRPVVGVQAGRVVVLGGREFLSNDQIGQADNAALAIGLLNWLTANEQLSAPAAARDQDIDWSPTLAAVLAVGCMILLPIGYLATAWWLRKRRRRA